MFANIQLCDGLAHLHPSHATLWAYHSSPSVTVMEHMHTDTDPGEHVGLTWSDDHFVLATVRVKCSDLRVSSCAPARPLPLVSPAMVPLYHLLHPMCLCHWCSPSQGLCVSAPLARHVVTWMGGGYMQSCRQRRATRHGCGHTVCA